MIPNSMSSIIIKNLFGAEIDIPGARENDLRIPWRATVLDDKAGQGGAGIARLIIPHAV